MSMARKSYFLGLVAMGAVLAGCYSEDSVPPPVSAVTQPLPPVVLTSPAGVPETPAPAVDPKTLASLKPFQTRTDPFALKPIERQWDKQQEVYRVFGEVGFTTQYQLPEEEAVKPEDIPEAQPYRRLAGVVVGDSILALIDMGNGTLEVIRPGQQIPNSEWRVISIDSEKAVLRRNGNRTPRQIIVRLESPPPGMGGGIGQTGGMPGGPTGRGGGNRPGVGAAGGGGGAGPGGSMGAGE